MGGRPQGDLEWRERVISYIKDRRYKLVRDTKLGISTPAAGGGDEKESSARQSVLLSDGASDGEAAREEGNEPYRLESLKPAPKGGDRTGYAITDLYLYALPQISYFGFRIHQTLRNKNFENYKTIEIREANSCKYKIFFSLKNGAGTYRGWWLVDPARSWALERFELKFERVTHEVIQRQILEGLVGYREDIDDFPRPASVRYLQRLENELIGPKRAAIAKQGGAVTSSVDKETTLTYSDYRLEAKPDREFTLASIGLGYAEVPVGVPRYDLWYLLAGLAVASLAAGIGLKAWAYKRDAARSPSRVDAEGP